MRFPRTLTLLLCGASAFVVAAAQDDDAPSEQQPPAAQEEEADEDIIVVTARRRDFAMAAFQRGDFETAEIEFLANARCALRRERNLLATAEGAQRDSARAETLQNATPSSSGATSRGAGAGAPPPTSGGPAVTDSISRDPEEPIGRSCDDRGFQHYMAGLSQLQLGKVDEALRNFEKATAESKVLFDAHYRIALIALLRGDTKTAERELRRIETILRRCGDCEARDEIVQRQEHLTKALSGEVKLN